ncbi:MAG: double zinc ribbon domain-containing protein [Promethearchaeota archaeon]
MIVCPFCGRENTTPGARFCINCGKPLPTQDMVECPKCKTMNSKNNIYCISCGEKLQNYPVQWNEDDLLRSTAKTASLQWKEDANIIFCPKCNYACRKEWTECPMCGASLVLDNLNYQNVDENTSLFVEQPDFADDTLVQKITRVLEDVIKNYSTISMQELARSCGSEEDLVLSVVKDLIVSGKIEGYIEPSTNEFISEINAVTPLIIDEKEVISSANITKLSDLINNDSKEGIDQLVKEMIYALEIKRGYEFEGGRVHFKVAIKNNSKLMMNEVKVFLEIPEFFRIEEKDISKTISSLSPGESRGLDFYLEPKKCGTSEISATILFKDIYGKRHAKLVPPKEVQIKTPIIAPAKSSFEFTREKVKYLASDMKMFEFKELDPELIYNAAFQAISKFDMSCVHDERKDGIMEAWFSAISKVDDAPVIVRIIVSKTQGSNILEIRVWCNDAKELIGFLAKSVASLRDQIELIRKIKAEDKEKTIQLMDLARTIENLKYYIDLDLDVEEIADKLVKVQTIVKKTLSSDDASSINENIKGWLSIMSGLSNSDHLPQESRDKLSLDLIRWQKIINIALGIVD